MTLTGTGVANNGFEIIVAGSLAHHLSYPISVRHQARESRSSNGGKIVLSGTVMTWAKILALVLFALALACGQILFKAAAQSIKGPLDFDAQSLFQLAFILSFCLA